VHCGQGSASVIKSNDGKTPLDLAMEAGHERASLILGEGITKRFKKGLE